MEKTLDGNRGSRKHSCLEAFITAGYPQFISTRFTLRTGKPFHFKHANPLQVPLSLVFYIITSTFLGFLFLFDCILIDRFCSLMAKTNSVKRNKGIWRSCEFALTSPFSYPLFNGAISFESVIYLTIFLHF